MSKCLLVSVLALAAVAGPVATASAARDRDHDGLPDKWEKKHKLKTNAKSGRFDPDHDGLKNTGEFKHRTKPRKRDTDRDGLRDGPEVHKYKTKPRKRDTDRDGLRDGAEVHRYKTKPRKRDTDGDGLTDGQEVRKYHTNPRKRDTDGDGIPDGAEVLAGSDPRNRVSTPPPPCTVHATTANFDAILDAAPAGRVICVAPGDYGSFSGASKSGPVWVRAERAGTARMRVNLSNARNIVLDGFTIGGGTLSGSTRNVIITRSAFTSALTIRGLQNANVLLDRNTHVNINAGGQSDSPARIHLSYGGSVHSGVTIQNSLLAGGDSDGIQSGVGVNILNNEFRDIRQGGPNHTDAIQLLGAAGSVIRGNYIHRSATGIVAYDGLARAVIERNVIDLDGRPWGIELYSDDSSIVRHNTLGYGSCDFNLPCGMIDLSRKSQDDAGRGTVVVDNVTTEVSIGNGSAAGVRHHTLVRRNVRAGDLAGVPVFVGGANPTSWAGHRLAAGSPGKGRASDGRDVGI